MDIVSSSVSSDSITGGQCQICFQEGHGFHFGAFTCRACAAFFRRCHFSVKREAKCVRFTGDCQPRSGRWFCKACRLNRCVEQGMTTDNIQYHRDAFTSSVNFVASRSLVNQLTDRIGVPMTVEKALGVPHIVLFLRKEVDSSQSLPFIDVSELVKKATSTFLNPSANERKVKKTSDLEQLAQGLVDYQSTKSDQMSEVSLLTRGEQVNDWDRTMCAAAEWLASSDRIRSLDDDVKIVLLQSMWLLWGRLERIAVTARMRVNRQCGKRQFVISNDSLIDYDRVKADLSWGSTFLYEELQYFFVPTEVFYDEIVWDIVEIQPDSVEFAFILCIICLEVTGNRHGGRIEEEMDSVMDGLADDLHNYYLRSNRTVYSGRLKQLMRIKEHFLVLWKRRREKFQVGAALDVFRMQFSAPDFFTMYC